MPISKTLGRAALISMLLGSTAVQADVTADDVWGSMQTMMEASGSGALSVGGESRSGDTLTVSDVALTMEQDGDTFRTSIAEIVFTENGDGTVTVTMSDRIPVAGTSDGEDFAFDVTSDDFMAVVSGEPEMMNYAVSADSYAINVPPGLYDDMDLRQAALTMSGISGSYVTETDGDMTVTVSVTAETAAFVLDGTDNSGGGGPVNIAGAIQEISLDGRAVLPEGMAEADPDNAFVDGFDMAFDYAFGGWAFALDVTADGQQTTGQVTADGGTLSVAMNKDGFSYAGSSDDPQIALQVPDFPFPIQVAFDEVAYAFDVPLSQSDEPSDFGMSITLAGFTINDMIWSLFDPGAMLPRDPATIALDVTGQARLFYDVLDPSQAEAMAMAEMPGELDSVTLNKLQITAAGADIRGDGAFTFDNSDMQTFPGMPRPEGELNVSVNGLNGLIDTLIQMGLVPEEQAMGARMMLGLFAKPVGDDMLESKIEITGDGQVLANGQRIR